MLPPNRQSWPHLYAWMKILGHNCLRRFNVQTEQLCDCTVTTHHNSTSCPLNFLDDKDQRRQGSNPFILCGSSSPNTFTPAKTNFSHEINVFSSFPKLILYIIRCLLCWWPISICALGLLCPCFFVISLLVGVYSLTNSIVELCVWKCRRYQIKFQGQFQWNPMYTTKAKNK